MSTKRKRNAPPVNKNQQITNYFNLNNPPKRIILPVPVSTSTPKAKTSAATSKTDRKTRSTKDNNPNVSPIILTSTNELKKEAESNNIGDSLDSLLKTDRAVKMKSKPAAKRPRGSANIGTASGKQMAAELERLANEEIGALLDFPTDSDSENEEGSYGGLNASQGSESSKFVGRTRQVMQSVDAPNCLDQDTLHIQVDFAGFSNLCRSNNVFALSPEDSHSSALDDLKCQHFELIFLLAPTHPTRMSLLHDFYRLHGVNGAKFAVDQHRLNSVLRFIVQFYDHDNGEGNYISDHSTDDGLSRVATSFSVDARNNCGKQSDEIAELFKALFPTHFNNLSLLVATISKGESTRNSKQKVPAIDWREHRKELCLENLKLFFSFITFLDFSAWKSGKIATLFLRFAIIYMDEIASPIRAQIGFAIQTILDLLDAEKAEKVLERFFNQLATVGIDCRALFLFISGLLSLKFFMKPETRCFFLKAFFEKVQQEVPVESSQSTTERLLENLKIKRPTGEVIVGLVDLLLSFYDVARRLSQRPTDLYVIMQMLGICMTDSVIRKEPTEVLTFARELIDHVLSHMGSNRLDEVVLRSMSDLSHRVGMVIHRRRGAVYERQINASTRYRYYSSSSSEEAEENAENLNEPMDCSIYGQFDNDTTSQGDSDLLEIPGEDCKLQQNDNPR